MDDFDAHYYTMSNAVDNHTQVYHSHDRHGHGHVEALLDIVVDCQQLQQHEREQDNKLRLRDEDHDRIEQVAADMAPAPVVRMRLLRLLPDVDHGMIAVMMQHVLHHHQQVDKNGRPIIRCGQCYHRHDDRLGTLVDHAMHPIHQ